MRKDVVDCEQTYHGLACKPKVNKNRIRKYGEAVGSGNKSSGRNHLVHLQKSSLSATCSFKGNPPHMFEVFVSMALVDV